MVNPAKMYNQEEICWISSVMTCLVVSTAAMITGTVKGICSTGSMTSFIRVLDEIVDRIVPTPAIAKVARQAIAATSTNLKSKLNPLNMTNNGRMISSAINMKMKLLATLPM